VCHVFEAREFREELPRSLCRVLSQPTAREQLTPQTSTGPNPGDPRFVVLAFPSAE